MHQHFINIIMEFDSILIYNASVLKNREFDNILDIIYRYTSISYKFTNNLFNVVFPDWPTVPWVWRLHTGWRAGRERAPHPPCNPPSEGATEDGEELVPGWDIQDHSSTVRTTVLHPWFHTEGRLYEASPSFRPDVETPKEGLRSSKYINKEA